MVKGMIHTLVTYQNTLQASKGVLFELDKRLKNCLFEVKDKGQLHSYVGRLKRLIDLERAILIFKDRNLRELELVVSLHDVKAYKGKHFSEFVLRELNKKTFDLSSVCEEELRLKGLS